MVPPTSPEIAITGLGVISAIGVDLEDFAAGIFDGRPGLRLVDDLPGELPRLCGRAADFSPRAKLPARSLRRCSRLTQMAVVAARDAAADAALSAVNAERIGVVVGTGLGALAATTNFMREFLTLGPAQANPALFPISVMNSATAQISIELGFKGYSTTVNHQDASALGAVALAADLLRLGRADAVLCGGVDELTAPMLHGYRRFRALTPHHRGNAATARPFDRRRDGLALGEGAAMFVLERAESARARRARAHARLTGLALGGAVRRPLSWNGGIAGAAAVMRRALAEAGLSAAAVSYVAAGANGSRELDQLEAGLLAAVFGDRPVPTSSILGQTGDFQTAAGLRLVSAVLALERQRIPGTVGFDEADPAAPVPGLVRESCPAQLDTALCCAHATGGAEVAIVVGRA